MPTFAGRDPVGNWLFGERAERLPIGSYAKSVKRAITYREQSIQVTGADAAIDADTAISGVLSEMRRRAESLGLDLRSGGVRLSCPAQWDHPQRSRLMGLALGAGIPVSEHSLIDEPVAAGVAWIVRQPTVRGYFRGNVLVVDIGGGTLDVAYLEVDLRPGEPPQIKVLASIGSEHAGDSLDVRLAQAFQRKLTEAGAAPEVIANPAALGLIERVARNIKVQLSDQMSTHVRVPYPGLEHITFQFSRQALVVAMEQQLRDIRGQALLALRQAVLTQESSPRRAQKIHEDELRQRVDHVVLVGGMSHVPAVRALFAADYPRAKVHAEDLTMQPFHAIALGLAETSAYESISFNRPAFQLELWIDPAGDDRRTLFESFGKLTGIDQIGRDPAYYEIIVPSRELPATGHGIFTITTPEGQQVDIRREGEVMSGIKINFGTGDVRLRIYLDGNMMIEDGRGTRLGFRVANWPLLTTGRSLEIVNTSRGDARPIKPLAYPHNNLYG